MVGCTTEASGTSTARGNCEDNVGIRFSPASDEPQPYVIL